MRKRVLLAMVATVGLLFWTGAVLAEGETGACCDNGSPLIPQGQPCVLLHQVGPGENLHILAAYYYGDARAWQRIYNLNKKAIGNPNKIRAGQVLRIEVPPCWVPRFVLSDFMQIEARRVEVMGRPASERPREVRTRQVVESKVQLSVEEEGGGTAEQPKPAGTPGGTPGGAPPASGAPPAPATPAPGGGSGSIEIEE